MYQTFSTPITVEQLGSTGKFLFEHVGTAQTFYETFEFETYINKTTIHANLHTIYRMQAKLRNLCEEIKLITEGSDISYCTIIIQQIHEFLKTLSSSASSTKTKNKKRFVLYTFNFGSSYEYDINQLNSKTNDLKQVISNQMLYIEQVINSTNLKLQKFESALNNSISNYDQYAQENYLNQELNKLIQQLILTIEKQREDHNLINNPEAIKLNIQNIFPPAILLEKLKDVEDHIFKTLEISYPVKPTNSSIHKFYKFSQVQIRHELELISVSLLVPIITGEIFYIIKPTVIPQISKIINNFHFVRSNYENFAINMNKSLYFPLDAEQLNECFEIYEKRFLCKQIFNMILPSNESNICELDIYRGNVNNSNCEVDLVPASEVLIELQSPNKFIFATYKPQLIVVHCENNIRQQAISNSNLLEILENCIVFTEKYKISKQSVTNYSKFETNTLNITEYEPEPLLFKKNETYEEQIEQIQLLINKNDNEKLKTERKIDDIMEKIKEKLSNKSAVDNVLDKFTLRNAFSSFSLWSIIISNWPMGTLIIVLIIIIVMRKLAN